MPAVAPPEAGRPWWPAVVATAAGALIALTSWQVAGVPVRFAPAPPLPYVGYYLALAALIGGWLILGRRALAGRLHPRTACGFLLGAAVPLLASAPFGRDLWAYAAQGHLAGTGVSPYAHGPAAAPGAFAAEVSTRWLHSPAPYGPLWLRFAQFAAWLSGGHPTVAALLLRLPAFAGLLVTAWALYRLAGDRAARALWLGAANPLVLVLGLGGGHNDLVMIGLILAAVVAARRPGTAALALAGGLLGAAVLIKSPAAIAVPFVIPLWLQANRMATSLRRIALACLTTAVAAAATVIALSAACGLGYGWTGQVGADSPWVSWLSLPTGAAMLVTQIANLATGATHGLRVLDGTVRAFRTAGEAVIGAATAVLWVLALRGRNAVGCLALALGIAAALAPAVQPWYFCWGIAAAAVLALSPRLTGVLAWVTVAFTVMITPSGAGWESDWRAPLVLAGAAVLTSSVLRRSVPDDDGAQPARTDVRADHRTEFGHV